MQIKQNKTKQNKTKTKTLVGPMESPLGHLSVKKFPSLVSKADNKNCLTYIHSDLPWSSFPSLF